MLVLMVLRMLCEMIGRAGQVAPGPVSVSAAFRPSSQERASAPRNVASPALRLIAVMRASCWRMTSLRDMAFTASDLRCAMMPATGSTAVVPRASLCRSSMLTIDRSAAGTIPLAKQGLCETKFQQVALGSNG